MDATSDVGVKIAEFVAEVAKLLGKPVMEDCSPSEALQRAEEWCYAATDEKLDNLQQKLHDQHERIGDVKALWKAVWGAREKVSKAQQLVEESLAALSGIAADDSMGGLLREIELLDGHLRGASEKLEMEALDQIYLSHNPPDISGDRELDMAKELLNIIGDVSLPDETLVEKLGLLGELCGTADVVTDELEKLKPDSEAIDGERLKTMGLICSQLESSNSTLSEAALTARLLSRMYEIEQIETELHVARSRHQEWEKRIDELKVDLKSRGEHDEQQFEVVSEEESCSEVSGESAETVKPEARICPNCSSKQVIKKGFSGGKQRYWCKECKSRFTI